MASAQKLQPGFDPVEYKTLMYLSMRASDAESYYKDFPLPEGYVEAYRSPIVGLDNFWQLWLNEEKKQLVISIRGTTAKSESWLANFYAAMVPATGILRLSATDTFHYSFSENERAAVHVGWLLSTAYLSKSIVPKLDSCQQLGYRDVLIVGHSQGGAIAYLLTSYLNQLKREKHLPQGLRIKTYGSAAPKPGNLYYAHSYARETQEGWAYNVVNSADWVPETPFSIQTVDDFNTVNPFVHVDAIIAEQSFPKNVALRYAYRKLDGPTKEAQENFEKYLGKMTSGMIKKYLPDYIPPEYANTNHYVRTGNMVVLYADETYYELYPNASESVFVHHFHAPYLYLLEKQFDLAH
jgi:hypothetical protein